MKTIPEIDLKDAETLSALDMNIIHFDTGDNSNLLADSFPGTSSTSVKTKITSLSDLK